MSESPARSFEIMSMAIVLRSADTNRLIAVWESAGRRWKFAGSTAANGSAGITACRTETGEATRATWSSWLNPVVITAKRAKSSVPENDRSDSITTNIGSTAPFPYCSSTRS